MKKSILEAIKQLLCEHEFRTLYLDSRIRYDREQPVRYWVCGCHKCGKIIRIESRRTVL